MGILTGLKLTRQLMKIDKESKKDKELEKRLIPIVADFNNKKPTTIKEAEEISNKFIAEYRRIKEDIKRSIDESGNLRKIE